MKPILLMLLLVTVDCNRYHIIINERCLLKEECLTLDQFATNINHYLDSNTTLFLEPGNHSLYSQLNITDVTEFKMFTSEFVSTTEAAIICGSSGRLNFNNISYLHINGIVTFGCVCNRITLIKHFVFENLGFYGHRSISGPVMLIDNTKGRITGSLFEGITFSIHNENGVVIKAIFSNIVITNSVFKDINSRTSVVWAHYTYLYVRNCKFLSNSGDVIGAVHGVVNISKSQFFNNTGNVGTSLYAMDSLVNVSECVFRNNKADISGGAIQLSRCNAFITESSFYNNSAESGGALSLYASGGNLPCKTETTIRNSNFSDNECYNYGGAVYVDTTIDCDDYLMKSVLIFQETCILSNNHVVHHSTLNFDSNGGALSLYIGSYHMEFTVLVHGKLTIVNNTVDNGNGGGIYLENCELICQYNGSIELIENHATMDGGGIYAKASVIKAYISMLTNSHSAQIYFIRNRAMNGGALYLYDSTVHILTPDSTDKNVSNSLTIKFIANSAITGGAVYVDGNYKTVSRRPKQCFFQVLASVNDTQSAHSLLSHLRRRKIKFSQNLAMNSGSGVYKEVFGRCTYGRQTNIIDEFERILEICDIQIRDIGSHSVQVCFCVSGWPDCTYQRDYIDVISGRENITIEVAIADRGNHAVNGSIKNQIQRGLIQIQQRYQNTYGECTLMRLNVFSTTFIKELIMIPIVEYPYINTTFSCRKINIRFPFCKSCPIGFEKVIDKVTGCDCVCDAHLKRYIIECDAIKQTVTKGYTTAWIGYVNSTKNSSGYLIYSYCPFDYCLPQDALTDINFNIPNGPDKQCAHNRSGTLCGKCGLGFSLSLGSSKCLLCPSYWPGLLVTIIASSPLAGLVLVIFILTLNLTVAVGTMNGIIFYANIIAANINVFFPSTSFLTVFLSWINLELGIDTCFFEGMDAYMKVWIELAFPSIIIMLVVVIIVVSERCVLIARLIGKKNPVATLNTLILLSYMKFLRIIITSFSFAVMEYPDKTYKIMWLPDATVAYFSVKHVVLMIVATIILIIGIAYTCLLFFWQWLLLHQRKKVFRWVRYHRLSLFMEPYHAPYVFKHRYWTGLLLLIRVVLYIISAANVSGDPSVALLATAVLVSGVLILKCLFRSRSAIYKHRPVEFLEISCYVNILWFCLARYHTMERERGQFIVSYVSGGVTLILFLLVVSYHALFELFLKTKLWKKIKRPTGREKYVSNRCELTLSLINFDEGPAACTHTEVSLGPNREEGKAKLSDITKETKVIQEKTVE